MLTASRVLFLLPILVLVAVRLRTGRMPSSRLLFWALMAMVALGAALAWYGASRGVGPYYPAHYENGRVVPGGVAQ